MDTAQTARGELSIPSFASERCRAMTTNLIRTLEGIPPADDQALEDRALACFVVACGELASMRSTAHRDTVVEQLTVVARKLVKANAEIAEKTNLAPPSPTVIRNQAQGLAEGLMRGLLRNAARAAKRSPALQPAQRPILDLTVDPPEVPTFNRQQETGQEDAPDGAMVPKDARAKTIQTESTQAATAQKEPAQQEQPLRRSAQKVEARVVQSQMIDGKTPHREMPKNQPTREDTLVDATHARKESDPAGSWGEIEALIKQEVTEIVSNH